MWETSKESQVLLALNIGKGGPFTFQALALFMEGLVLGKVKRVPVELGWATANLCVMAICQVFETM